VTSNTQGDALLAHARELQRRDDEVAARIDVVTGLLGRAGLVRERASAVLEDLSLLPGELARNDAAEEEAALREDVAGRELAEELTRAREQLADARTAVRRLTERRRELVDTGRALQAEADGLAVVARGIADELRSTPRVSESGREPPGTGLPELVEWGARVHAALFVVRGGLESERERIVVEASTLVASVLGEQVAGTNVALVRRRLELHVQRG
jgi:hypothetical protein